MGNGGCLQKLLASEIAVYEYKGDFTTALQKMETYLESYPDDGDAQREYTLSLIHISMCIRDSGGLL